jgi:hypothetical protein
MTGTYVRVCVYIQMYCMQDTGESRTGSQPVVGWGCVQRMSAMRQPYIRNNYVLVVAA